MILKCNKDAFRERYGVDLSEKEKQYATVKKEGLDERFFESDNYPYDFSQEAMKGILLAMAMGFANGSFIRKLRKHLPGAAALLVWEPDWSTFLYACGKEDVSDLILNREIVIVVGGMDDEETKLKEKLQSRIEMQNMYHASILPVPGFFDVYVKEAGELLAVFKKSIFETSVDVASRVFFKQTNARAEIYAISQLHENYVAEELFDSIPTRDIPVIIVAAGPSLSHNIAELERVGNKALVIAVSHAARTVCEKGIHPDLVAVADGQEQFHFLDFDKDNKLRVLMNVKGALNLQKRYNGRMIYESMNLDLYPVSGCKRSTYNYANGGSVATNVFGLFLTAGFKTFIMVGQDLAYDKNGFSHVGNESEKSENIYELEGVDGEPVKARGDWVFFLNFYEKMIAANPDVRVVDATEGGALIRGTETITLAEALNKYCNKAYPIEEWFHNMKKGTGADKKEEEAIIQNHLGECRKIHKDLEEIVILNREAVRYLKGEELPDELADTVCERYDLLYEKVLVDGKAELLMDYCDDLLQLYVKEAMSLEADSDILIKMDFEFSLFTKMKERNMELMSYLIELFPDL